VKEIFAATSSPGVFYPLLVALMLLWLGLRALLRRKLGAECWEARVGTAEQVVLTILILGMIALSMAQIVLRNFFHTGLIWIEPLLRHLVLWIGFTGACFRPVPGYSSPGRPRWSRQRFVWFSPAPPGSF